MATQRAVDVALGWVRVISLGRKRLTGKAFAVVAVGVILEHYMGLVLEGEGPRAPSVEWQMSQSLGTEVPRSGIAPKMQSSTQDTENRYQSSQTFPLPPDCHFLESPSMG